MLLNYKKKDLKDLVEGNHDLYNTNNLIGDKLRTVYVALGWVHMTDEFQKADRVVEEMTQNVLEGLVSSNSYISATAGLEVSGYFDEEGMLNLDYHFNLA